MQNLTIWKYLSLPWVLMSFFFFVSFIFLAFFKGTQIEYLTNNYLLGLFKNTFVLSFLTAFISALIAMPLAILVTFYNFPGKKFFSWSLSLSIAFPAYVYAFIYVGMFEYSSPISSYLRDFGITLPSIKNLFGASIILSMALFPYIYLLLRVKLASVGLDLFRAAKSLGNNNTASILKVIIPSLLPVVVAGMTLVIFETIADFGGVSTLRIETFTVGIYNAWFGYQSYFSAARLAGYLLMFVFVIIFIAKFYESKQSNLAQKTSEVFDGIELVHYKSFLATLYCSVIFTIVFLIPLAQLLIWSFAENNLLSIDNIYLFLNSFILGIIVSVITVFFGITLALAYRNEKKLRLIISLTTSGYAIPGSVISAGLLVSFGYFFNVSITSFGILGLLFCLSLRFMTPAYNYLSASLANVKDSSEKALATYSKDSMRAFKYFYFPHMKSAAYLGLMIVFIESVKEQPATLLLRPVGFDTLSTKIYNFTSEGQWIMASNPSLMLVFLSLIFVYMINKSINKNKS